MKILLLVPVLIGLATAAWAQEYEDVHKCDEFAAHPNDPNRWSDGVTEENIIPGPALRFCEQAAVDYPDTPRFAFQLGRSLWASAKYEEGLKVFRELEEEFEYGPAYAYLGDAYMYGIGGAEIDQELAVALYQIANEAGFSPAGDVLAALAEETDDPSAPPETEVVPSSVSPEGTALTKILTNLKEQQPSTGNETEVDPVESLPPFDQSPYSRGPRLRYLYEGDFEALAKEEQYYILVYLLKMNDYFSATVNFLSESCSGFADPDLASGVMRDVMGGMFDASGNPSREGIEHIMKGLSQLATNPMSLINRMTFIEAEQRAGTRDGVKLAQLSGGCESPIFKRLYSNLQNYVNGAEPIMSPEVAKRVKLATFSAKAEESCVARYEDVKFCGCMTGELKKLDLGDNAWTNISGNFVSFVTLADREKDLRGALRNCMNGR